MVKWIETTRSRLVEFAGFFGTKVLFVDYCNGDINSHQHVSVVADLESNQKLNIAKSLNFTFKGGLLPRQTQPHMS